jgi:hypothetical protein
MTRKNCTNCKYGCWVYAGLYVEESIEKCNTCSGVWNNWVRKNETIKLVSDTSVETQAVLDKFFDDLAVD